MKPLRMVAVACIWAAILGVFVLPVGAVPLTITLTETPECDASSLLVFMVDELGTGGFPPDERITVSFTPTLSVACPMDDDAIPNMLVTMTNLTGRRFREVHYVADPETTISNEDFLINGESAFRIDAVGVNTPLVSESGGANGLFEPGETWEFIIDDYENSFFLDPSLMSSIGVGSDSAGLGDGSTGSIIALQVDPFEPPGGGVIPEPASVLLVCLGLIALLGARHGYAHRSVRART